MATKDVISKWFDEGKSKGAQYMLIACDTFDWEDYPVFTMSKESMKEEYKRLNGPNMQKVMEIYDLQGDKSEQLAEYRVFRGLWD
jgi:hypothetical protein